MSSDVNFSLIGKSFTSFADLKAFVVNHGRHTNQVFVCNGGSTSIQVTSEATKLLKFRYVTFRCTHGGSYRGHRKNYVAVKRLNTTTSKSKCTVMIKAKVNKECTSLIIYQATNLSEHNHQMSTQLMKHYPASRKMGEGEKAIAIQQLQDGIPARKVADKINRTRKQANECGMVMNKDVHNLRTRSQKATTGDLTNADELLQARNAILTEYPQAVVDFVTLSDITGAACDNGNDLRLIFVQTAEMRSWLVENPAVWFSDSTYRLNVENFNLIAVVVQDKNGFGLPVALGLLPSENQATVRYFFDRLKNSVSDFQPPASIFVDKDFSQMAVLQSTFPSSALTICAFHTVKIWKTEIAKEKIEIDCKEDIFELFRRLMYCRSIPQYRDLENIFYSKVSSRLLSYYTKNWENIKELWASAFKYGIQDCAILCHDILT